MLFDLRTYGVRPGTISNQLALYQANGFEVQRKYLGDPLFYGVVETGDVNSYVHLWRYKDAADREARRSALYLDPAWLSYRQASAAAGFQTAQTNTLLKPASFWLPGEGEA
ncbi:NIPSNAP family protein [Tardiphaga robiniae]|uniref:NIPSNAP family protein n=1 Tax=Tardiphaga robiniae TaxID=943830 RepID=UPI0015868B0B|nr:NIPSNAP family protein [Tardiphaga robiniae]NUU42604.1 NIPSNAP family protein [Tardiphaga robiniae]